MVIVQSVQLVKTIIYIILIRMVCLFFLVDNKFLVHSCDNNEAEKYRHFLNYPESHMNIWNRNYEKKYQVDFDYYPRGRVVYNTLEDCYYIYHDKCIENLHDIIKIIQGNNYKILEDFHYQCYKCNRNYCD